MLLTMWIRIEYRYSLCCYSDGISPQYHEYLESCVNQSERVQRMLYEIKISISVMVVNAFLLNYINSNNADGQRRTS